MAQFDREAERFVEDKAGWRFVEMLATYELSMLESNPATPKRKVHKVERLRDIVTREIKQICDAMDAWVTARHITIHPSQAHDADRILSEIRNARRAALDRAEGNEGL